MVRKLKPVVIETTVEQAYCDVCTGDLHEAQFPDFEIEVAGTKAQFDICTPQKESYAALVRAVTGIIIGDDGQPVVYSDPPVQVEAVDSGPERQPAATVANLQAERKKRVAAKDDPDAIMCTLCGRTIRAGSKYVHAPKSHNVKANEIEWVRVADIVQAPLPTPATAVTDLTEIRESKTKKTKKTKGSTREDLYTVICPVNTCGAEIPFPAKASHAYTKHRITSTNVKWAWGNRPDKVHVCKVCTGEFPDADSLERHVRYYEARPKATHKNGGVTAVVESKKWDEHGNRIPTPREVAARVTKPSDFVAAQGDLPAYNSTASPF